MQFSPTRILVVEDEVQSRTLLENLFVSPASPSIPPPTGPKRSVSSATTFPI